MRLTGASTSTICSAVQRLITFAPTGTFPSNIIALLGSICKEVFLNCHCDGAAQTITGQLMAISGIPNSSASSLVSQFKQVVELIRGFGALEVDGKILVAPGVIPAGGLNSSVYDQSQTWTEYQVQN